MDAHGCWHSITSHPAVAYPLLYFWLLLRAALVALPPRVPAGVVPVLGHGGFVVRLFASRDPP
jgi:hypothetical protein